MTAVAPLEIRRPPGGTGGAVSQDYREHVEGLLISLLDSVVRSHEPALAGITTGGGKTAGAGKFDVAQTGLVIKALQAIGLRFQLQTIAEEISQTQQLRSIEFEFRAGCGDRVVSCRTGKGGTQWRRGR